ncbi:MAG: NAD-dependent epimerase/dehydratase family protein [Planctomycetes bacterium]|nr:NAD-dependent epimerase/dehydratase family protein [Planctomycetota bacterium]
MKNTVLVTGCSTFLARRLCAVLLGDSACKGIVALAAARTEVKLPRTRTHHVDYRGADFPAFLKKQKVDVVYHLDFAPARRSNEELFERNVLGTMHLLSSCAEAGVKKVVLASSTWVYGALHDNPTYLAERRPLRARPYLQYLKDQVDIERYAAEFRAGNPEIVVTVLRFAPLVGPSADGPIMQYLALPLAPVLLGFEPLLQVLHEEDAVQALHRALHVDCRGAVNIAPDGVLPLHKLLRMAGVQSAPILHPLAEAASSWLRGFPLVEKVPLEVNYLKYCCMGDTTRMREEFGFSPERSGPQALKAAVEAKAVKAATVAV